MSEAPLPIEDLQQRLARSPFIAFLNMTVTEADPAKQSVTMTIPMRPEFERGAGTGQWHGGPLAAIIDTVGDYALVMMLGRPLPTVNFRVWYDIATRALVGAGLRVVLFTNGSPEDRAFLARHGDEWCAASVTGDSQDPPATIAQAFATPGDLVDFITGCDLIIAHRMHACILAHSFAIPAIGLKWDEKLDSFFTLAGREGFIADCADLDPVALIALTHRALATGVDRAALDKMIAGTRADVARLAERISRALEPKTVL